MRAAAKRAAVAMTTVDVGESSKALGWYRELNPSERRTFWACFGGWALDAMDVQIYSFVIPTLIVLFGMSNAFAGWIGTATLLTSAFGGWMAAALSDRLGRYEPCRSPSPVPRWALS